MKRSCQPIVAVAVAAMFAIALTSCGGDSAAPSPSGSTTASPTAPATPGASPTPTPFVHQGAPITPADATAALAVTTDPTHYQNPIGAYGGQIIMQVFAYKSPDMDTEGWSYSLWDPVANTFTPEWTDAPGLQETYMQSDGDWVETVTRGFGGTAGMADWTLIIRNLKTGEMRTIAKAQPGQADIDLTKFEMQIDPNPGIADGKVVWSAADLVAGDGVQSTIHMYDIATATDTAVEVKTDHAREDLWSPSIGGGKVAWVDGDGTTFKLIILDLATQKRITFPADATIRDASLTPDGHYIVVETASEGGAYDKYVTDVTTGERHQIASGQGWGVFTTPGYFSWDPSTISGGMAPSGLYDIETHELRSLTPTKQAMTNVGHVFGDWFVWQDVPLIGSEYSDAQGHWYAMRLPASGAGP